MIDDADDARLYGEVSALAKALSLDRPPPSSSSEPSSLSRYWNPFKLLPRLRRRRRLDCRFSLHVHSITSLPPSLAATALRVHWKHSTAAAHTNPAPAIYGTAQFDEILTERCSIYGSRSGPHRSAAYEARPFLLYATVESDPYIDLGRHRVDLARLLPVSLEEQSSGEWSTSFRLSGKATGASLNVSFGFSLAVDSSSRRKVKSSNQQRSGRCEGPDQLQRSWSCFRGKLGCMNTQREKQLPAVLKMQEYAVPLQTLLKREAAASSPENEESAVPLQALLSVLSARNEFRF